MMSFISGETLLVITSGGDAPGMNPALRSVVRCWLAKRSGNKVYYAMNGYKGLLSRPLDELDHEKVAGIMNRGGTEIGAGRFNELKNKTSPERKRIGKQADDLRADYGVAGCVVIGGNGSFTGMVDVLQKECRFHTVGIPATIDNDIWGTDLSLGVDTALNTAVEIVDKIRDTAAAFGRAFIVELMGRDCGYLALATAIATEAEAVFTPEKKASFDDLKKMHDNLNKLQNEGFHDAVIIVAEGSKLKSQTVQNLFEIYTEGEVRRVVPGYTLRGGSPSAIDRILGCRFGYKAVNSFNKLNKSLKKEPQIIVLEGIKVKSTNKSRDVKDIVKKSGKNARKEDKLHDELAEIQKSLSQYHDSTAKSGVLLVIHGPDAPGINAAIRAFTRTALDSDYFLGENRRFRTIAVRDGFKGLSAGEGSYSNKSFVELDWRKTIRFIYSGGVPVKLAKDPIEPIRASPTDWLVGNISEAVRNMRKNIERYQEYVKEQNPCRIEIMVVIGGRDAIKWIEKIKKEAHFPHPIIFIPATIDNDLYFTDYSIGFDTAVNKAIKAIDNIKETALAEGRVFLIETMGGLSGFLPMAIGLASGAEHIFIPELFLNPGPRKKDIMNEIKKTINNRFISKKGSPRKTQSILVFHECVMEALGGLESITKEINGYGAKSICSFKARKTILGYTLRGGSPSAFDRILATRLGANAAKGIADTFKNGEYKDGFAVALRNNKIERFPILSLAEYTKEQLISKQDTMKELAEIHCQLSRDEWMRENLKNISLFSQADLFSVAEEYKPTPKAIELWEKFWKKRNKE